MFFGSSKRLKDTTNLFALRVGDMLVRRMKKVKYIRVIVDEQLTGETILTIFQPKSSEILVLSKG